MKNRETTEFDRLFIKYVAMLAYLEKRRNPERKLKLWTPEEETK